MLQHNRRSRIDPEISGQLDRAELDFTSEHAPWNGSATWPLEPLVRSETVREIIWAERAIETKLLVKGISWFRAFAASVHVAGPEI